MDESYENGQDNSRRLVEQFFQQRYQSNPDGLPGFLPFIQLKTTLSILMITVFFAVNIKKDE
ncbi:hypothetical protein [Leptolyngbya sp. O-77]|uniref:hypothetical protein n=1 Tax=Leptolyngbya sp. O-77 TaxID=1080068 RepID=UPI00074D28F6|nr:hypothetical protein [Leptolyngbya sp. O-77]BAU41426.1 hypothetical protein O77CONTIG1_01236 [Leptolyngbya sp. O-77]